MSQDNEMTPEAMLWMRLTSIEMGAKRFKKLLEMQAPAHILENERQLIIKRLYDIGDMHPKGDIEARALHFKIIPYKELQ